MLEFVRHAAAALPAPLPLLLQDLSLAQVGIATLQSTQIPGMFLSELQPETRSSYSKFAKGKDKGNSVPSRHAMTWIYAPAATVSLAAMAFALATPGFGEDALRSAVVPVLLAVHFTKRVLEVRFLHKYSGEADLDQARFIGTYYALVAALVTWVTSTVPAEAYATMPWTLPLGLGIFATGILGNLWHHKRFVDLRKDTDAYVIPSGGFFGLVTAPHYFFELVGWLGIACVSLHLNAFLVWASMCAYLSGRAVATTGYYEEKFGDDWPKERKHIVPFLF